MIPTIARRRYASWRGRAGGKSGLARMYAAQTKDTMMPTETTHEPMHLPVVDCCASCAWVRGFADNAWCAQHFDPVLPSTKCDTFERRAHLPVWVTCRKVQAR